MQVITSLKTQKNSNIDWYHIQDCQKSSIYLNVPPSWHLTELIASSADTN